MIIILSIVMFIVPAVFAVVIHNYLRHGELTAKRKLVLFIEYSILINFITFGVSYLRGVKGLYFQDMTLSYRLKYLVLGGVLGFVMPFIVCLLIEDIITKGIRVKTKEELVTRIYKYFDEINENPVVYHWKYKLEEIDPSEEVIVDTLSVKQSS